MGKRLEMLRRQTDPFQSIQLLCLSTCSVMAKLKTTLARCSTSSTPMATEPSALALLNMMAFFIEMGMDTGSNDMAMVMSEVFMKGDKNKDELLNKQEFITGMTQHPVTKKILEVKTIDALLATF